MTSREQRLSEALFRLYKLYTEAVDDEPDSTTAKPPEWLSLALSDATDVQFLGEGEGFETRSYQSMLRELASIVGANITMEDWKDMRPETAWVVLGEVANKQKTMELRIASYEKMIGEKGSREDELVSIVSKLHNWLFHVNMTCSLDAVALKNDTDRMAKLCIEALKLLR